MKIKLKRAHAKVLFDLIKPHLVNLEWRCWCNREVIFSNEPSFKETWYFCDAPFNGPLANKPCMPIEKAVIKIRRKTGIHLKLSTVLSHCVARALDGN